MTGRLMFEQNTMAAGDMPVVRWSYASSPKLTTQATGWHTTRCPVRVSKVLAGSAGYGAGRTKPLPDEGPHSGGLKSETLLVRPALFRTRQRAALPS